MTQALNLSPEDAALERDPTFRRDVIDAVLEEAEHKGIFVDGRCRRLLAQYAGGEITYQQLNDEVVRPFLH